MFDLRTLKGAALVAGLGFGSTAFALPWNLDMVDSQAVKAYERYMAPLPDGVMSQENLLTPVAYRRAYPWRATEPGAPETWQLVKTMNNPFSSGPEDLELGARMYEVYCAPCHGDGVNLGPVSEKGYPGVAILGGDAGVLKTKSDGHVFYTIYRGSLSGLMPAYGYAMTEEEMWSIVSYMRASFPNSAAPAPEPVVEGTEETEQ